ncbi:hypothetical protein Ptr902_14128 [Pyrenophora tritici-repentis]|nr:hypothetical protein Ptr902_14128 [Pyrenophora tritici-repentis]
MAKLSLGSDNESACHPDLATPPDLATVTESLIGLPKQIIKRYYGNRIRFFTDYAGIRHSLAWAVKIDDVIQPFAILFLTPPDGRLEIEMKDEDDIPVDGYQPMSYVLRNFKIWPSRYRTNTVVNALASMTANVSSGLLAIHSQALERAL